MNRTLKILLAGYLLFSILYSARRYQYFQLDGDLPAIVLSHGKYQTVMHDPFGMNVLLQDSVYPAPNRFFTHWAMAAYFLNIPQMIASVTGPINAVYVACSLAKTFFHFFILWLLAVFISGRLKPWHPSTLLAAALILPLFQTFGYNRYMGIIDHSITYSFFYAGAFSLVLLFFLPGFLEWFHDRKFKYPVLLMLLAVVMLFNGPLNAGVIVLLVPFILLAMLRAQMEKSRGLPLATRCFTGMRQLPSRWWIPMGFAFLLALFSLYLGTHNSENLWDRLPLSERYARLPEGLYRILTQKIGWPLLIAMSAINTALLFRFRAEVKARKIITVLRWIGLFTVVYLATLPLGGYREYRPLIVRMDTFLPLTLCMILYFGLSSHFLLSHFAGRSKKIYVGAVLLFLAIFFNADFKTEVFNDCEKQALEAMARSKDHVVKLEQDCTVLSWNKHADTTETRVKGELMYRWNITPDRKVFYQDQ